MSKKILVVIDPGHVGSTYNAGAVKGYFESSAVWTLSQYEKTALESYGIHVIITKKNINDNIELYNRGQIAVKNAKGYDEVVFYSNHSNAFNGKAYGVSIIRSAHLPGSVALGNKIADAIVNVMRPVTGVTYNRGVSTKQNKNDTADWYGVIRGAVSGAKTKTQAENGPVKYDYIIEHGFHDNKIECSFLVDNNNLKKIAEAKARVIAEYFGLTKQTAASPSFPSGNTEVKVKYKVRKTWADSASQKGAFSNLSNAKTCADKNPGYSVFDESGKTVYTSKSSSGVPQIAVNGIWDATLTKRLQQIFGTTVDGVVSNQWAMYKAKNPGLTSGWDWHDKPNGKGSELIRAIQKKVGMPASEQDGEVGNNTFKYMQKYWGTTVDGFISNPSNLVRAIQTWANKQ